MPNVEHSTLSSANLHEPKGASTASAGQVYVADGAGSGAWKYMPNGFGYYKDSDTAQVFNTTAAKLSINGVGAATSTAYLPPQIRGSAQLWDVVNDKITPITAGDTYDIRLDLPISATSGSPGTLTLQLDIGGGVSPSNVVVERDISITKAAPFSVSIGFPIFCLSTFLTNGGQIFLKTNTGTVSIDDPGIMISMNGSGAI